MGKLARPLSAVDFLAPREAVRPVEPLLDSHLAAALRASFEPVMNEPVPDRLQDMIEMIRTEEKKRGAC